MVQKGILCLTLFLFAQASASQDKILGAGASFPAPLYRSWFKSYTKSNPKVEFNYQTVGSGAGVERLLSGQVDFGASDIPMTDSDLKRSKYKIIHIPSVVGAIAIIYNHSSLPDSLKIDASTLCEIFQAKIRYWNHPKIQTLNPSVILPDSPIQTIVREDHSGTSQVLRRYLRRYGFGKNNWQATFTRATGSQAVSTAVKNTESSIGYINLSFAKKDSHKIFSLKNSKEEFILPESKSLSLAASKVRGSRVRVSLLDLDIEGAYPLTSFSFFLVPSLKSKTQKQLRSFIKWALSYGQQAPERYHYAPLPKKLAKSLSQKL